MAKQRYEGTKSLMEKVPEELRGQEDVQKDCKLFD